MSVFATVAKGAVRDGLALLAPFGIGFSQASVTNLLAIGWQESSFLSPYQYFKGPARGLWQFEIAGVRGVLSHPRSSRIAVGVLKARRMEPYPVDVHQRLAVDDALAAAFARLLLWTYPHPMALTEDDGWRQYVDLWRPGEPRRDRWSGGWLLANDVFQRGLLADVVWPDPAEELRGTGAAA
jgi:hypothetical protein